MNLYQLRYFLVLAKVQHYTRAATALNITQPSLSHAIFSLEEELGVQLFDRTGRRVRLTKYGTLFQEDVAQVLSQLDHSVERLQRMGKGADIIELGFLRGMSADFIPQTVSAFQRTPQGQGADFHFSTATTQELLSGLQEGRYDLVFCSFDSSAHEVAFFPVYHLPLCLVVPQNHPLSDREQVYLSETLDEPHIIFDSSAGIRAEIGRLYHRLERKPQISYEIQEDRDIAGLVAHDFGIAVLPKLPILKTFAVCTIPLADADAVRHLYLAIPKGRYLTPAANAFQRFVLEQAKNPPPVSDRISAKD